MQTQETLRESDDISQTSSIQVEEEDKPESLKDETPTPDTKPLDEPQEQMQALIAQMKELQERLQQSESKVKDFEQKIEDKPLRPRDDGPSTKEFIDAKAKQAKEFASERSKEVAAVSYVIGTAIADGCRATQRMISEYRGLLMSLVAMIFVGFLVKHEIKQSNEIHSLTQTVQQMQVGLLHSNQFNSVQVQNLEHNMIARATQMGQQIENQQQNYDQWAHQQINESVAKTDQQFLNMLAAEKLAAEVQENEAILIQKARQELQAAAQAQDQAQANAKAAHAHYEAQINAQIQAQAQAQAQEQAQAEVQRQAKEQEAKNRAQQAQSEYQKMIESAVLRNQATKNETPRRSPYRKLNKKLLKNADKVLDDFFNMF